MIIEMKLSKVRESRYINMHKLSKLSGVAYSHIWQIEHENRIPSLTVLCKLAVVLEVEPQDLYTYKP